MVTPDAVQILAGVARNFITEIHVGREFNMDGAVPRLGADVPRWYGETIGFWDNDTLITWTSNIQGWTAHGAFEFSNKMQTIEIYTPNRDAAGNFLGLNHEAIFYDPEALVEPVRIIRNYVKDERFRGSRTLCLHRMRPDDLSYRRKCYAGVARHCDRVRSAGYLWPSMGTHLGKYANKTWKSPKTKISSALIKLVRYTVSAINTEESRDYGHQSAQPAAS